MAPDMGIQRNGNRPVSSLLEVEGVRIAYGDLVAVWDVSFDARAGEVTAIVGRNGAGKTTLMFGLAGVLRAVAGTVTLDGTDVTAMSSWERAAAGLSLVPEGKRVFRDLTVEENLLVGMPRKLRSSERRERCQEVFARFPILADKQSALASALSGGQQQALAIASALLTRPQVLLVDEPSSGLAPTTVDALMSTLDELKRAGMAIVLVEQMIEDVITGIADEVVVIEQGRVVMRDVPERISLAELERRLYVA